MSIADRRGWGCGECGEFNKWNDKPICRGKHHQEVVDGKYRNLFEYGELSWAKWCRDQISSLPVDSQERKDIPLARGLLDYFPAALAEVARLSMYGNDKHNPGEELHHARGKSTDHADCIMRHLVERGIITEEGFSHTVMVAWRALALLQEELEAAGAPLARGARLGEEPPD